MENFVLIGSILLIHFLRWFIPGPQIALIIRNSVTYSRRTGFWTAAGFATGNFTHITLTVIGIGVIISQSPAAYNAIKFLGSAYLIYLGLKTFFRKPFDQHFKTKEGHHDLSPLTAWRIGLVTNLLNPNAPLFFISIFGPLLATKTPYWVVGFLMVVMPLNSLFMASMWTLFFTQRNIMNFYAKFQPILNKILGGALVLFALKLVLAK